MEEHSRYLLRIAFLSVKDWGIAAGARTLYVTWKNHDGTISGGATTEPKPVEPSNPVQPASIFTDTSTHWAKETIDALVDRGTISDYPDGTFRPNESMKRKHVASIMAKVYEFFIREIIDFRIVNKLGQSLLYV